jgi:hypothetical protein
VALLERDREATPGPGTPPPAGPVLPTAPDFACEACGAAMERGQDWCLECGTAAPGRLGARPGWRAAFTVVGLTTVLLCCAIVAAYAALTSDSERTASAPASGSANPIVATAPATTTAAKAPAVIKPGVTGPGVLPKVAPVAPGPAIIPKVNPQLLVPAQPAAPATPPAGSQAGTTTGTAAQAAAPVVIKLKKDAAQTYDPDKRAGAEFGPAAFAIDTKLSTVWDVVVPADGKPIDAGLVIDLGKPYALRSLRISTPTEGFTVEVYGAKSAKQLPEDVIDKRWIHLTDKKSVLDGAPIVLKGKGDNAKVQLLLLHITQPSDPTDPRVAIGNVLLRGTPSQ